MTMEFIPEMPTEAQDVPYFGDVTSEGGWQGHSTTKSVATLKSEVIVALSRLGGLVTGFQRGRFQVGEHAREGFRIHYAIEKSDGVMFPGRLDVAALPVKETKRGGPQRQRAEKSLKMALYMLRNALDGAWFLQQLSPGYSPLMPWLLDAGSDKTVSQLWAEAVPIGRLLPPADFVDGEFEEIRA